LVRDDGKVKEFSCGEGDIKESNCENNICHVKCHNGMQIQFYCTGESLQFEKLSSVFMDGPAEKSSSFKCGPKLEFKDM